MESSSDVIAQLNEATVAQTIVVLAPEPSKFSREPATAKVNELLEVIPYNPTEKIEGLGLVTASPYLEPKPAEESVTLPGLSVEVDSKTLPAPVSIQDTAKAESGSQLPVSTPSYKPLLPKSPEMPKNSRAAALSKSDTIAGSPAHLKSKGDSVGSFVRAFERLNKKPCSTGNRIYWIHD